MGKRARHMTFDDGDHRCAYCNKDLLATFEDWVTRVRDHLLARSRGGPDGRENRRPACRTCDRLKRNFPAVTIEEARTVIERERQIEIEKWQSVRAKFRKFPEVQESPS